MAAKIKRMRFPRFNFDLIMLYAFNKTKLWTQTSSSSVSFSSSLNSGQHFPKGLYTQDIGGVQVGIALPKYFIIIRK